MPPISLAPPVSDVSGKVSVTKITTVLSCVKKVSFEPPVSDEKVSVTKNEHFLKLCQEGQSETPVGDEKSSFPRIGQLGPL